MNTHGQLQLCIEESNIPSCKTISAHISKNVDVRWHCFQPTLLNWLKLKSQQMPMFSAHLTRAQKLNFNWQSGLLLSPKLLTKALPCGSSTSYEGIFWSNDKQPGWCQVELCTANFFSQQKLKIVNLKECFRRVQKFLNTFSKLIPMKMPTGANTFILWYALPLERKTLEYLEILIFQLFCVGDIHEKKLMNGIFTLGVNPTNFSRLRIYSMSHRIADLTCNVFQVQCPLSILNMFSLPT